MSKDSTKNIEVGDRPLSWCLHRDSDSIREASVATAQPGWELDPSSIESMSKARVCFKCLCQWTMTGEIVVRSETCQSNLTQIGENAS